MTHDDTAAGEPGAEPAEEPIRIVLVSGFLGAGKTTALRTIGTELTDRGYTVGMITNDQASGLVDTSILDRTDAPVVEIPGGCFCCNFEQLLKAAHAIGTHDLDLLLAEPVGSCTDLVATVVNPLRSLHAADFTVAPLTTVLDPERVRAYLSDDAAVLPEEVRYIFRMQVEEADLLVLNKTDTLGDDETARLVAELEGRVGDRPVLPVSAREATGIDRWLTTVLEDVDTPAAAAIDGPATTDGRALTDIDYDTYAEGEAKLGWVNLTVSLAGQFDATRVQRDLMDRVRAALRTAGIEVAHLKFSVAAADELAHANLTSTAAAPSYSGPDLGTVEEARLLFNARAVGGPAEIRRIAEQAIDETAAGADVAVTVEQAEAFRPEYPEPVHRMAEESAASGSSPTD